MPSIFDEFAIFGLSASVDTRPLPGAWVAELLGVVLGVQDHKKIKFQMETLGLKGLTEDSDCSVSDSDSENSDEDNER